MTNELRHLIMHAAQQRGFRADMIFYEDVPAIQAGSEKLTELLYYTAYLMGIGFHDQRLIMDLSELIQLNKVEESEEVVILY